MKLLPDSPDIACALRTGYPQWMLPELSDDDEESPWPAILANLEAYGNPAGACLEELPPKGGTTHV